MASLGLEERQRRENSQPDGVHSAKTWEAAGGLWKPPHPCMCQGAWTLTPHGDDSFSICGFVMCFWAIPLRLTQSGRIGVWMETDFCATSKIEAS